VPHRKRKLIPSLGQSALTQYTYRCRCSDEAFLEQVARFAPAVQASMLRVKYFFIGFVKHVAKLSSKGCLAAWRC
jgi:hypothetical protein